MSSSRTTGWINTLASYLRTGVSHMVWTQVKKAVEFEFVMTDLPQTHSMATTIPTPEDIILTYLRQAGMTDPSLAINNQEHWVRVTIGPEDDGAKAAEILHLTLPVGVATEGEESHTIADGFGNFCEIRLTRRSQDYDQTEPEDDRFVSVRHAANLLDWPHPKVFTEFPTTKGTVELRLIHKWLVDRGYTRSCGSLGPTGDFAVYVEAKNSSTSKVL